jgi:hypothetical protein
MTQLEIVQNDKGIDLAFTLQNNDGTALNLTGAALTLKAQHKSTPGAAVDISGSMTIVTAAAGTCKYTTTGTDFITPGKYDAEIEVNFNSGQKIQTFPNILIEVIPQLPKNN